MSRLKRAAFAAAAVAIAGCTADSPLSVAPDHLARPTISDAARGGPVAGFYFLPPMVKAPRFSGTFDAAVSPRVVICELAADACASHVAEFTMTSGPDGERVTVNAAGQEFKANWHTNRFPLDPAKHYRIAVEVGAVRLGFADVDVVASGRELKNVDTGEYIALLDGRTLPIKFRIETGIAGSVVVAPDSAVIEPGQTQAFTATVLDLHGAPLPGAPVAWATSDTTIATVGDTGVATGVATGTATVTATSGAASDAALLRVAVLNSAPLALPDSFDAVGNVSIPVPAPGLLANDTDAEANALQVVAETVATAAGGTATLAADGSFTYRGAPGFVGTDSFAYTVTDGSLKATATATLTSSTRFWFVRNDAAAPGDGRDASPFATLKQAEAVSAPGETVFVLAGDGTTSGLDEGIALKPGQALTGQGVASDVTLGVNGVTVLLLDAGAAPSLTRGTPGTTVRLATGNTVQGLDIASTAGAGIAGIGFGLFTADRVTVAAAGGPALNLEDGQAEAAFVALSSAGSAGAGLRLVAVGGSLAAPTGSIGDAATAAVEIAGGDAAITLGASLASTAGHSVSVSGRSGGVVTLSGSIQDSGLGIRVQGNAGGSVAFSGPAKALSTAANDAVRLENNGGATISFAGGGLAIATTTGSGFVATGGGTVTVTGAGNAIGSAGGTAVRVENTTIGTNGMTFRSISAAGGSNGIVLVGTGALNGLQVTGTGSTGSGGAIRNVTGADGTTAGIGVYLSDVRNVFLSGMRFEDFANFAIRGVDVTGFSLTDSEVAGTSGTSTSLGEAAIAFDELTGSATITRSTVAGGVTDNVRVVNTAGVLDRITFSSATIGLNGADGDNGLELFASGSARLNATVQGAVFAGARADLFRLVLQNSASGDLVVTGTSFHNAHSSTLPGAGGVSIGTAGTGGAGLTYTITGNSFRGAVGSALAVAKGGETGSFTGTISGNTFGVSGVANSGSAQGSGISLELAGGGSHAATVTSNQVFQFTNFGVRAQAGGASPAPGRFTLVVQGNRIAEPSPNAAGFPTNGIRVQSGVSSGDNAVMCATIGGAGSLANTVAGTGANGGTDVRLFERFTTTMALPGYAGAPNDNAAVAAFVQGNNGGATVLATNNVAAGGPGFVGSCP